MARPANQHTYTVRQYVTNWLKRTTLERFTRAMMQLELTPSLEGYKGLDVPKSLENELIRRHKMGLLAYEIGEPCGVGRPPRIYRQIWKP